MVPELQVKGGAQAVPDPARFRPPPDQGNSLAGICTGQRSYAYEDRLGVIPLDRLGLTAHIADARSGPRSHKKRKEPYPLMCRVRF